MATDDARGQAHRLSQPPGPHMGRDRLRMVDGTRRSVIRPSTDGLRENVAMTTDVALLLGAAAFAAHKHRDQRRKDPGASPYINHPLQLACVLANDGGVTDTVTLCAALLHDTVEDTDTTLAELQQAFGAEVAAVVAEVTDDKRLPKAERKRAQVEHAAHISARAQRVKLADKICNLRDVATAPPPDWSLQRRREYFDWAREVIDRLRGVDARLEAVFDAAYAARP